MKINFLLYFRKTVKLAFVFCGLFLIGCKGPVDVIKLDLPKQNPMSYTFNFSKPEIIRALLKGEFEEYSGSEFSAEHSRSSDFNSYIPDSLSFILSENFFCINQSRSTFPMSRLYFSDEMAPIESYAHYIIRIFPLTKTSTKVEIISFNRELLLGETWDNQIGACMSGYSHRGFTLMEYPPTTIEEYEILLKIGEALGVASTMPKIYYPDYTGINFENNVINGMYDFKPIVIE